MASLREWVNKPLYTPLSISETDPHIFPVDFWQIRSCNIDTESFFYFKRYLLYIISVSKIMALVRLYFHI